MKISKSKQELASIIRENGGWRYGADTCSCDHDGYVSFFVGNPTRNGWSWLDNGDCEYIGGTIATKYEKIKNWHQTILSREEYFHLYPAPDDDGWIEWNGGNSPVKDGVMIETKWSDGDLVCHANFGSQCHWDIGDDEPNIIAYRLHKPERAKYSAVGDDQANLADKKELETMKYKPSIEQLMQIHCDRAHELSEKKAELLVAEKQELEALEALKAACMEAGFDIAPITTKQESELVITDWRDLQVGDEIEYLGGTSADWVGRHGTVALIDHDDESPILFQDGPEGVPGDPRNWMSTRWCDSFRFIRRT